MLSSILALAGLGILGCGQVAWLPKDALWESPKRDDKVVLKDEEWKSRLTEEQYRILRVKGTERPFCSPLNDVKEKGAFHCVGCELELFKTDAKFQSGTGWPSFFQPAKKDAVWYVMDHSHGMTRVEILCARCDGHLGHVFPDGPEPTSLRFCINGEVLKFKKSAE
jgi:methionine-R-sulfoxide reductase